MGVYYNQFDKDLNDWLNRIMSVGEIPNKNIISAVGTFVFTIKTQNIWNKLSEIYILSGVNNFNSIFQKLKYISTPTLTNSGFISSNYTATGSFAGLASDGTAKILKTGVSFNDLIAGNRAVGVYETKRINAFYASLIGRERGGGNSAFGPNMVNGTNVSEFRFLDTTTVTSIQLGTSTSAAGFFACSEYSGLAIGRANQTSVSSAFTPGTISGDSYYWLGGGIGGGGYSSSTVSFGFLSSGLSLSELVILDSAVNTMMTAFSCNIY